ncbi:MAG: aminotransferase class III-fold pyridoxal phosphate-dependent enzyme [Actinomycetota bacterium]|nr:aminotransferase class III-fold pyridoxal phosphate-dependent enzyme [Actinomycetota bacterium]
MTSFWHPFANMAQVAQGAVSIERGEGVYVYDTSGKRYLDGTASLWYMNVGYGRTEIGDAMAAQSAQLAAYHTFGDFTNPVAEELCSRLAATAPIPGSRVFLASGGSDAVDTAAKLSRRYFTQIGQSERTVFIMREWAYHGMHAYGTSLAGLSPNLEGHGPMVIDVVKVPHDDVDALADTIDRVGPERVAAFWCEPVVGAGGVRPVEEAVLKQSRSLVADAGALFVADEVITGFGRCGDWFASTRFSLEPDLVTFAKGVTSGYAPLGGVIASPRVAEPFWSGEGAVWRHGYTYSGHPVCCAAALANLDILEAEGLLARALELEAEVMESLAALTDHPTVDHIRGGVGVMAAVQLNSTVLASEPSANVTAATGARQAGVITRAIAGGGLQVSPPLTITRDQLDELTAGLRAGLDAV